MNTCKINIEKVLRDRQIIHSDPEIMSGTPVFVGTRVPLQTFFDYLEGEAGLAEFLEDFPHLQAQVLLVSGSDCALQCWLRSELSVLILLDENLLSKKLKKPLVNAGKGVQNVEEMGWRGVKDRQLLALAQA